MTLKERLLAGFYYDAMNSITALHEIQKQGLADENTENAIKLIEQAVSLTGGIS